MTWMTENLHRHKKAKYSNYTGALCFTTFLVVLYKVKCKKNLRKEKYKDKLKAKWRQ